MSTEGMSKYDILDLSEDMPIILVGEAKSLRGELRLRNPGTDHIQLGKADVRLQLPGSTELEPFAQVSLPTGLQPGQAQKVNITLDLDPLTPPGEYKGELEASGYTREVIVFVAEVVRLVISPKVLVIDQPSGSKVNKQLILSNEGNTSLTIGPIGQVALGEELMLRHSISTTVAAAGEKELQAISKLFVDLVSEEAKAVMGEAGYLNVVNKPMQLKPGDARLLDLEIHLPNKLTSNSRYIGRVPLYTSELEFVIVPVSRQPTKS